MIYIDSAFISYRGMKMCHMLADNSDELLSFSKILGLKKAWMQYPNTYKEHFDICEKYRVKAITHGAIVIDRRKMAMILRRKKESLLSRAPSHQKPMHESLPA